MALAGHIADFPLAELFFYLSSKQRTGQVVLKRPGTTIIFTLRRGRLIAAQTIPGDYRIGDRLVADGVLTAGLLAVALEVQRQDSNHRPLGELLVELGYVDATTVLGVLRKQIADCLFRFLIAPGGTFTFREKAIDPRGINVDVSVEREVLEAIRRADEWIAGQIDTSPLYLNQHVNAEALQPLVLDHWEVVDAMFDGARTVAEVAAATGWTREKVVDTIVELQAHGAIDLENADDSLPGQPAIPHEVNATASIASDDATVHVAAIDCYSATEGSPALTARTAHATTPSTLDRSWISPAG